MVKLTKYLALAIVTTMVALAAIPFMENTGAVPTGWNEKQISADYAPQASSIAVDSSGKVHIIGVDANYYNKVFYMDDVSGSWSTPYTIDSSNVKQPGIAVDSAGKSHVAYVKDFNLKYATNAGGSWVNTTICPIPQGVTTGVAIAVDHANKVYITFNNYTPYSHVYLASNVLGYWTIENVTPALSYESWPYLAIDSNNKVHIACFSTGANKGLVYHANTTGTWSTTLLDSALNITNIAMCVDHNDKAHIAYETSYTNINYTTNAGSAWQRSTVTRIPVQHGDLQYLPQIVVDSSNNPSICYTNNTAGAINEEQYVHIVTKSGSSWTNLRLGNGLSQSMAISATDEYYVVSHRSGTILDSTATITGSTSTDGVAPGPLTSVKATAVSNKVTLTWEAPTTGGDTTWVKIYRSLDETMPASPIITIDYSKMQYADSAVETNKTYHYWLVSSNTYGNGPSVSTAGTTVGAASPSTSTPGSGGGLILLVLILVIILVIVAFVFIRRRRRT